MKKILEVLPGSITLLFVLFAAGTLAGCSGNAKGVDGSGTIEADTVRVAAQTSGRITSIAVEEGTPVSAGDTLFEIDNTVQTLEYQQAQTARTLAENQLQLLLNGAREEDIEQAEAHVQRAAENLKSAREDFNRMKDLYQTGSVTQKQRDDAQARLVSAQAEYDASRAALRKIQNLARPEEVRAARLKVEQARQMVSLKKELLSYTSVHAPRTGIVTKIPAEAGELAAPGIVLCELADLDTVHLTIYVGEPMLGAVHLGQPADVYIDAYPDRPFSGKVVYISDQAEFTPRNVQTKEERTKLVYGIKIRIPNPDHILKAGMPADAVLQTDGSSS